MGNVMVTLSKCLTAAHDAALESPQARRHYARQDSSRLTE
jgi:hypothetical protein